MPKKIAIDTTDLEKFKPNHKLMLKSIQPLIGPAPAAHEAFFKPY